LNGTPEEIDENVAARIADLASEAGRGLHLQEVIVGLGFTLVCLDSGACGLAYTLRDELERGCDAFSEVGRLQGRAVSEAMSWIGRGSVIASAVGLAAANALLLPPEEAFNDDLLALLGLQPGERLVTVGRFRPMELLLRETGAELEVIEAGDPAEPLRACDVALITATSIINDTLESLLAAIEMAREVAVLGPSTPYAPSAFAATPVTLLAGSTIADPGRVRAVVREGGGTQTMGKSLRRWVASVGGGNRSSRA